ncbi:MAG: beta-ketoacyl synthase N-terminal-like domain-containing protein, partial [Pseudomonadota bacterium]
MFEPIAVVGRSCVLPGALSPDALWHAVVAGHDLITAAPPGHWGLDASRVLAPDGSEPAEHTCTDRGGYVSGFEQVFDPEGYLVASDHIRTLDPLFQWLLHCARESLKEAGIDRLHDRRTDVLVGNLSYPTPSFARFAEAVWLQGQDHRYGQSPPDNVAPENRFTSGYPAHLVARALGARGVAFALDAACASSLYAIKLGCDRLQDRDAELVLAGAVNHADDLFLHMGFTALQALSPSGQSRPFHRDADGLLPAEGAAFVTLKRLSDAEADGDRIHGVIRGIGLSNDGRKGGFLAPDSEGQIRAIRSAYDAYGVDPNSISLLECHATGTAVGDGIELASIGDVFGTAEDLPLGSLKSNLGHLITASGMAGLIKVMAGMAHGIRPPTLHADVPTPELEGAPLRPLHKPEPWNTDSPRRAAINNFGFGGNNAHLVIEEWQARPTAVSVPRVPKAELAICGIGVVAGPNHGLDAFAERLLGAGTDQTHQADEITLPLAGLRFPPSDLGLCLAQQTAMLEAALDAIAGTKQVAEDRMAAIVGMGCDAEICRYGLRWRLADRIAGTFSTKAEGWLDQVRNQVVGSLSAAGVLGTMPNIPANRMNAQFDWRAFGFTVSGEELSGLDALRIAARALRHGEID